jgi:hypothetical protein
VEIFCNKLLRPEFERDFVVAGNAGSEHFAVADRDRRLVIA